MLTLGSLHRYRTVDLNALFSKDSGPQKLAAKFSAKTSRYYGPLFQRDPNRTKIGRKLETCFAPL